MTTYTVGSLFSGIGGFDLAASQAGFDIEWQVEIDDYCNRVLARHWPDVSRYRDVRTCTGYPNTSGADVLTPVDVMVGGFPCQDISYAGNGAGIAPGTRSGLWFEFARLIGELRPRVVVLENVAAITSRDGVVVIGDLAEMGYDARWGTLRASDAGAPHQRERWFCVAYDQGVRNRGNAETMGAAHGEKLDNTARGQRYDGGRNKPPESVAGDRTRSQPGQPQPRLGRSVDGLPAGLDVARWPAPPGPQHAWEPPRIVENAPHRTNRLKALGNAVVPQVVYPIMLMVRAWLERDDAAHVRGVE